MNSAERLVEYWKATNIPVKQTFMPYNIERRLLKKSIILPDDFLNFYKIIDGMLHAFQNDCDKEGFLFYPIDGLITMAEEFSLGYGIEFSQVIIFADYLTKCWWYGFKTNADGSYSIGIIPHSKQYKVITNSLDEFIDLLIADNEILYTYD